MDDQHLYQKITTAVRNEILTGNLKPGDRLPSIRQMMKRWECTPGTVQRAYQDLARQGLVISRAGQGTHVVDKPVLRDDTPLRRATLINRAETFLLEALTAGFTPVEVENALRIAWEHWRVAESMPVEKPASTLRFVGSHDPAISWLAEHCDQILPGMSMTVEFCGSLGGLIALAQEKADIAGCHLWDMETDTYNAPYVKRLLPGRRVALITLAHRRLGLIVAPGNPAEVRNLSDLTRPGLCFINRQTGSGTRVWLDAALHKTGISTQDIRGYEDECMTHSDVARVIAEGQADVTFGSETAALSFGLSFIPLVRERYDLAIPEEHIEIIQPFVTWLGSVSGRQAISDLGGYEIQSSGQIQWIE